MNEENEIEVLIKDIRDVSKELPTSGLNGYVELMHKLIELIIIEGFHIIELEREVKQLREQLLKK